MYLGLPIRFRSSESKPNQYIGQGEDSLHLLVTRHPYEWLDSMRRNAFYNNFHKGQNMSRFLTLQYTSLDVRNTETRCASGGSQLAPDAAHFLQGSVVVGCHLL